MQVGWISCRQSSGQVINIVVAEITPRENHCCNEAVIISSAISTCRRVYMFKPLLFRPSHLSRLKPLTKLALTKPPLNLFGSTAIYNMPLITSTGKPRVILGTMTFGPDESEGARITDINDYNKILDRFQGAGYNEIDTARVYVGGKQEAFTREARWKERGLTCATKWYPHTPGAHAPDVVEEKLNQSLKELGTDCIDIFYLHAADRSIPFQQTLEKLNELHKAGKFVQLGLSNFTAFEVAEIVMHCKYNNWVRPTIYQGMVS